MKPSYREHYVNLAVEQNRTKSLASEQLFTKSLASEQNHTKSLASQQLFTKGAAAGDNNPVPGTMSGEESNDIGSEDCGVNVFEDGTILEDFPGEASSNVLGEAVGQSSSDASHSSFPLDQQAMTGGEEDEEADEVEEVEEEVEHVEEGGKEENDDEEEEGLGETELLGKDEKGEEEQEGLVVRSILANEEMIKEEEEELERQDRDPLDMEVGDGTTGDAFTEELADDEQMMKSSNLAETLIEERGRSGKTETLIEERGGSGETLVERRRSRSETLVEEERGPETLVERRRGGETLPWETETLDEERRSGETLNEEKRRIGETAEEVSARELDEATLSIADPDRGERDNCQQDKN